MNENFQVVVGIPSYNESRTIGHVVQMVGSGLNKYFPDSRSAIVNCDNCSPDGTRDVFLSVETPERVHKKYISTPEGIKGKGNNFFNLFNFCRKTEAKVMVVVDADLQSITPEWIKYLGYPILDGHDYVTPLYSRHQFDGTITNHFCYPLVFSLMGFDVRQPIGGDFAFSPKLCSHWLEQEWNEMNRQYGIDIFMSLNALSGDFSVCQSGLGAKIHNASFPNLDKMFEEVVYTLFSTLLKHKSKWLNSYLNNGSGICWQNEVRTVNCYGLDEITESIAPISLDILKLKQACRKEYDKHQDLLKHYLDPYAYQHIHDKLLMDQYDINIMLWSQIVYKLLYLFDGASEQVKIEIINVLKPLYFARSITFDYQTYHSSIDYAESEIRKQAMAFLSQKPYLLGLFLGQSTNCHSSPFLVDHRYSA